MPKIDLQIITISKAHDSLLKGDFSAVELAEAYLAEIEKKNTDLNAYLEVFDDVREQAKAADRMIQNLKISKSQNISPLLGIPLAIKDNILIKGRKASAASKMLENYVAPYDATAIKRLKAAGAIFLGRTNMDEFAMGSSTENSAYGVTKNPHDISRVVGGSSGGSAAAVAAHLALAALGSDTGGSVRQPASLCGVVGLKPTYGAVSRSGLIAMSSSLDVIGPIAKTVEDAKILFEAIRGKDSLDSTSLEREIRDSRFEIRGLRIGVPRGFFGKGVDADVLENFNDSLALMERRGCVVKPVSLPLFSYALPVYYIIMFAEVSTNLARFDGVKYGLYVSGRDLPDDYRKTRASGFGAEARRRILLGTYVLSSGYYDAYYGRAVAMRGMIQEETNRIFSGNNAIDIIATPTAPTPAFRIGEKAQDPLAMYLADIFTVTANIAGIPAISIPSGFAERGGKKLPLGLQLMAAHGREDILFAAGKLFESAARE